MKNYILGFAILGLVGCFLPLIGGTSISLFDLHHLTWRAWLVVAAFAVPAVVAWRGGAAATALVSLVCFGYLGLRLGPRAIDLVWHAGIGGKLVGVAVVGGVVATIGALLDTKRA